MIAQKERSNNNQGPMAVVSSKTNNQQDLPQDQHIDFVLIPFKHFQPDTSCDTGVSTSPLDNSPTEIHEHFTVVKFPQTQKPGTQLIGPQDRRLMAVLVADVVGYCRLMHTDETFTVNCLNAYKRLMAHQIESYGGRLVDAIGDNLMATFPSVANAVQCSVNMQHCIKEKNHDLPEAKQMKFRMGIHLGDVVCHGRQIYGDTVNIAARLQSIAEPGGIRISNAVHEQVMHKLDLSYDTLGEQRLKNIPYPMAVYRVADKKEPKLLSDRILRESSL
ncbi:MAG: adenylate/guanylate cyclase domain-containing protein [Desulfobacteraceae bacterium]|nr:adenylate/guanylate cyclase domain-containing protein [Desulfobacteraceae bacterium]